MSHLPEPDLTDPDSPEWTEEMFARSTPASEAPQWMLEAFPNTKRRGSQKAPKKVPVSIRLSPEVVDHFKADGPGWQTRLDDALKAVVAESKAGKPEPVDA